jgi:hypothetical protein
MKAPPDLELLPSWRMVACIDMYAEHPELWYRLDLRPRDSVNEPARVSLDSQEIHRATLAARMNPDPRVPEMDGWLW